MGSIGGLIGTAGGLGGTGFNAPSGTNSGQLQGAYGNVGAAAQAQNQLLSALQAQNGLGNQSQVYGQLQNVASGQGPNPAQAMLNQATGQNIANQASLEAGQRGAASNVGLIARNAGLQGANIQQQAVGQGATMQAQQALNALTGAGNMANTMAGQQIGQTNQNLTGQQNEQNILQGANTANNNIQGQLANTQLQGQQAMLGGMMQGLGSGMSNISSMLASGGEVQKFDEGGAAEPPPNDSSQDTGTITQRSTMPDPLDQVVNESNMQSAAAPVAPSTGLGSMFGQTLAGINEPSTPSFGSDAGAAALAAGASSMVSGGKSSSGGGGGGGGGGIMGLLALMSKGGSVGDRLKSGGHVPGQAKVKGNSYKNDTVKALLSPGEVVIPKSVMESGDPARGAAQFVQAIMAKKRNKA